MPLQMESPKMNAQKFTDNRQNITCGANFGTPVL
jgi:hypothetical protein